MHNGVIVRVGDKTTMFDSHLVSGLVSLAQQESLPFQRCLMSGGTCEATAFQSFGYQSAGLCVALGNYHNCMQSGGIGPEYVSLADVEAMQALCVAAVTHGIDGRRTSEALKNRLEAGLEQSLHLYKSLI